MVGKCQSTVIRAMAICAVSVTLAVHGHTQSDETFRPVVWGPDLVHSDYLQYSAVFQSAGHANNLFFLNVVRSDGTWVVQNLLVGPEPGLSQIATNIPARLFESGEFYHTTFNKDYQMAAPAFVAGQAVIHMLGDPVNYLVNGGACRDGYGVFAAPGDAPLQGVLFPPPPPPPNPPFKLVYRKGVPDTAQGKNECAPTSAANSLSWMEDEYDDVAIGLSTEEIRDTLKTVDYMNTSSATGTSDENFVAGKNAFAEDYGLPITTKAIPGGEGKAPGMEELFDELEKGSDVELSVVWKDKNGNPAGGHWVTVVGMVEIEGQYGVYINDPDDDQEQTQFHWIDTHADGTTSLRGYGGDHYIDLTIAESVTPAIPGCIPGTTSSRILMVMPFLLFLLGLSRLFRQKRKGAGSLTSLAGERPYGLCSDVRN